MLIASLVALLRRRDDEDRRTLGFYVTATIVCMVLALGPIPRAGGVQLMPHGPYAWLMDIVPGFNGLRVPARFALIALLCLAIAASILLARVRGARARPLMLVLAAIALIDSWPSARVAMMPLPPLLEPIALTPGATAVLELPVGDDQEFSAMYRAMFHQRPLVNGYSGYSPASYERLRECLVDKQPGCLTAIRQVGSIDVVIDRGHDRDRAWEQFVAALPDAEFRYHTRLFTVFHLPAQTP
jgi:hypothetical protein